MNMNQPVTRRAFLQTAGRLAALLGLGTSAMPRIAAAVDELYSGHAPVLWLQGADCTGCSVSLLNSYPLLPLPLLTRHISLKFHQTLSTTQGTQAAQVVNDTIARGGYVLVVEGSIPVGLPEACSFAGEPFADLMARAIPPANAILAVGACASFGGIPSSAPNPIGAVGVREFLTLKGLAKPLVNVPGCPPHPDWMVGTIVHLLKFGVPDLDGDLRPRKFFGATVHSRCPLFQTGQASTIGDPGCMKNLGCRGQWTYGDCPMRRWNGEASDCLLSRGMCIGCTSANFAKDGAFYSV
jgi:hydrogenase small subunit